MRLTEQANQAVNNEVTRLNSKRKYGESLNVKCALLCVFRTDSSSCFPSTKQPGDLSHLPVQHTRSKPLSA